MVKILMTAAVAVVVMILVRRYLGRITGTDEDVQINNGEWEIEHGGEISQDSLLEFAVLLSNDSTKVFKKVKHCVEDPEGYLEKYEEDEEEREVAADFAWYEIAAILQENRFAWFIDWRGGYQEVRSAVDILLKKKGFPLMDWSWAEGENGEPYDHRATGEVLFAVHKKLEEIGVTLASMDTGADDYMLIVMDKEAYGRAKALAAQAGYRITTDFH